MCGGGSKLNKIGHRGGSLGNLIVDELQLVITSFQWLAHWWVLGFGLGVLGKMLFQCKFHE